MGTRCCPLIFASILGTYILKLQLTSCAGEIGRTYEANVDDVGYRLVIIYTPVREDGVEGQPISASTEPIAVGIVHSPILSPTNIYYYDHLSFLSFW